MKKTCMIRKRIWLSGSFLYFFHGRDYRSFTEIFWPVPQDTRKARIISRPAYNRRQGYIQKINKFYSENRQVQTIDASLASLKKK